MDHPLPASEVSDDAALRAHHFATAGEKKFDLRVYSGIGWIANALLSIGAVLWVERTHSGQRMMERFTQAFTRATRATSIKPETAQYLASKSFFLTGGFAVLVPMKLFEDAKVTLVKRWNRQIYGQQADDPFIRQSERQLEEAPRQGWASFLTARAVALIPFYIAVGMMWDRTSLLSRWTNPALRTMTRDAAKAMERTQPEVFGALAGRGLFMDRPVTFLSRAIGKVTARAAGNDAAVRQIERMERVYPGKLKEGMDPPSNRDPIHSALPNYAISEAITSGMVAAGVYLISRVTGPLFGRKSTTAQQVTAAEPALSIVKAIVSPIRHSDGHRPENRVEAGGSSREAMATATPSAMR